MSFQLMVGLLIASGKGTALCVGMVEVVLSEPRMKQGISRVQHNPSGNTVIGK